MNKWIGVLCILFFAACESQEQEKSLSGTWNISEVEVDIEDMSSAEKNEGIEMIKANVYTFTSDSTVQFFATENDEPMDLKYTIDENWSSINLDIGTRKQQFNILEMNVDYMIWEEIVGDGRVKMTLIKK